MVIISSQKNKLRIPEDYADTFRVLGEAGVLEDHFVGRLIEMVKSRNRIVHIYWDVDDETISRIIKEDIQDIDYFVKSITESLDEKKG